jgi:hypothetical protein
LGCGYLTERVIDTDDLCASACPFEQLKAVTTPQIKQKLARHSTGEVPVLRCEAGFAGKNVGSDIVVFGNQPLIALPPNRVPCLPIHERSAVSDG